MATISEKELRDNLAEVLYRAEAGEELAIAVSGRLVASLGPVRDRSWVPSSRLAELWCAPADTTFEADIGTLGGQARVGRCARDQVGR